MKDEIKEIIDNTLEYLEGIDETRNTKILTPNETKILLDYITNLEEVIKQRDKDIDTLLKTIKVDNSKITNLQEENERLNDELKRLHNLLNSQAYQDLDNYKLRNEKANELIDNYDVFKEFSFPLMKRDVEQQIKSSIDYEFKITFRNKLKNILNGGDE